MLSRRQILHGFAAVAASSLLSGCGANLYSAISTSLPASAIKPPTPSLPKPIIPPPPGPVVAAPPAPASPTQPLPIGAITASSLTVFATTVGTVGPGFVGLAYEKQALSTSLLTASNSDLIGLFKRLGSSVLGVGGSSVDTLVWTPNGNGQTPGQIAPPDIDALASFLRATGWTCIYGINLGGSAMGAIAPALAAAEVAYVSQQLGASLVGIELGNECERYGDPSSYYPYNWSIEKFESLWMQYRNAILAATPSAPLTGPAAASDVYGWTIPFGEYVTRNDISLLTQHYTRTSTNPTVDDLVSPDLALTTLLQQLQYGAQSIDIPFRIDTCSSYADGGIAGVSNAYASSLWAIDMVFNTALGSASGLNFNAGANTATSPIADSPNTATLTPQPLYYGLLMATLAGQGRLLSTQLSAGSLNVTSYAVSNPGGGLSLVVVNKDATQNLDLSIALPATMTSATLLQMTQLSAGANTPDLTALSGVTIQGSPVAANGAFNPSTAYALTVTGQQLSCYVPALSAVLIQLS
jgi:hypothetical protein